MSDRHAELACRYVAWKRSRDHRRARGGDRHDRVPAATIWLLAPSEGRSKSLCIDRTLRGSHRGRSGSPHVFWSTLSGRAGGRRTTPVGSVGPGDRYRDCRDPGVELKSGSPASPASPVRSRRSRTRDFRGVEQQPDGFVRHLFSGGCRDRCDRQAAVFVCSLTTIIGCRSLLVRDNLAIGGLGTASLIGEVCCVLAALGLVPFGRAPCQLAVVSSEAT